MDLDASLPYEIKSSREESIKTYDRQLLFNLGNGMLLEIYEVTKLLPKVFSFNYHLHPMAKGNYLPNEV